MRLVLGFFLLFGAYAYAHLNGLIDLPRAVALACAVLGLCVIAVEIVLGLRGL